MHQANHESEHQPELEGEGARGDAEVTLHERALELALRYLERRDRTETEVRGHLDRRRLVTDEIDTAIGQLRDNGVIDDARFARLFCEDKRNLELWGRERITRSLRARGIPDELVDRAFAGRQDESEIELALQLLRRRFPAGIEAERRQSAFGVLIRKGFDTEVASDALRAYGRLDDWAA